MRGLVSEMWEIPTQPSIHHINNKGLDDKLKKFGCNSKTRHIDIKTKAIQEELLAHNLEIKLIPSNQMIADGLTKALPRGPLSKLLQIINPHFPYLEILPAVGGVKSSSVKSSST